MKLVVQDASIRRRIICLALVSSALFSWAKWVVDDPLYPEIRFSDHRASVKVETEGLFDALSKLRVLITVMVLTNLLDSLLIAFPVILVLKGRFSGTDSHLLIIQTGIYVFFDAFWQQAQILIALLAFGVGCFALGRLIVCFRKLDSDRICSLTICVYYPLMGVIYFVLVGSVEELYI